MRLIIVYSLIVFITIIALFLIKTFDISYPLTITTTTRSSEMAVVGEGKAEAVPDSASVEIGITGNAPTVSEVQQIIDGTNNKIIEAVKNLGIDKKDIKTSNYSINPNYDYDGGKSSIGGYGGNATLSVKVRKTEILPQVVEEATKAGANQIYGTRFTIENPQKYRDRAREEAIENAKLQAKKLAGSLGIKLGKITNIVESNSPGFPILMQNSLAEGKASGAPQLEPGTQIITSTVTLYFEKK